MVHLEALGAVLRATSILPALKRKYPNSHVTWVTQAPAQFLLQNNPLIDRLLTTDTSDLLALGCLEFDIGFCIDKSLKAAGVFTYTKVQKQFGFRVDSKTGAILPATGAAEELWELGLDNHKKFFVNRKPETQLMTEALELGYRRDPYIYQMTEDERRKALALRQTWHENHSLVVGINTGCSATMKAKRLSIDFQRKLVHELKSRFQVQVVLLGGGTEDQERNLEIARGFDVLTPSAEMGLRNGMILTSACDVIVSGDSLGMHMGIALQKWVVAWFGPTCAHEIDLYGRGVAVLTQAACSPCWKRTCHQNPMCYDQVSLSEILDGVKKGIQWSQTTQKEILSSKPHFSETSFLASP